MAKYVNLLHANNLFLMEKNYYLLVFESRLQSMFPVLKYSLRLLERSKIVCHDISEPANLQSPPHWLLLFRGHTVNEKLFLVQ